MEIISKSSEFWVIRYEGRFRKVPPPRFFDGQIVQRVNKDVECIAPFTKVVMPSWTPNRGWVYGEVYIARFEDSGGSGWWKNEDLFTELTDPGDKLIAEYMYRMRKIEAARLKLTVNQDELKKIAFALNAIGIEAPKGEEGSDG